MGSNRKRGVFLALIDKVHLFVVDGGVELRLRLDSYRKEANTGKENNNQHMASMQCTI